MDHLAFTLAGLCTLGGASAYIKKGSVPSMVAGAGIGSLYLGAGYLLKQNKDYGIELAAVTSLILAGAGIKRTLKTKGAPVPIMLAVLGLSGSAYYGKKYYDFYLQ
ncbi:uncharacterized protein V1510DRAFT_403105 [Dipodascopsis tothii]|uniref:uncharacterized protein n=1 Tax=Dipodascopsis tothii TaxID=44089 RepID=UPI0034CED795